MVSVTWLAFIGIILAVCPLPSAAQDAPAEPIDVFRARGTFWSPVRINDQGRCEEYTLRDGVLAETVDSYGSSRILTFYREDDGIWGIAEYLDEEGDPVGMSGQALFELVAATESMIELRSFENGASQHYASNRVECMKILHGGG